MYIFGGLIFESSIRSVVFPSKIDSIDKLSFANCTEIEEIKLPVGITSIDDHTFSGCSKLKTVTIPDGVLKIGDDAFRNCTSLSSVDIPESTIILGERCFFSCKNLKSIVLPENLVKIGKNAFLGTAPSEITVKNPDLEINADILPDTSQLKQIYGFSGSPAQSFAQKLGIEFIPLTASRKTSIGTSGFSIR